MKQLINKLFNNSTKTPTATVSDGVAIQAFGRSFAGIMNMRMYDNYKIYEDYAEEPFKIWGVSPFSISGIADPYLQQYATAKRTNTRVKADIRKNFDEICQKAHCDYFIMDNTPALIGLTEIHTQLYSLMGWEKTDFMDDYFNNNAEIRANYIRPEVVGFTKQLKSQYNKFIDTILENYDKDHIILIRSHIPQFYFDAKAKKVAKTAHSVAKKQFIAQLDDYFAKKTQCHVLGTAMGFFEDSANRWQPFGALQWSLKVALERDTKSVVDRSMTGFAASYSGG
ncbi:MAG: hypothetical protein FWG68_07330, partial [Defluviitaleaceae bacterium]|nr:hypothetical protein [Defluviitaleaceae bacterium]